MFDPCHIGDVPFRAVKRVERAYPNRYFAILELQHNDHTMILKRNTNDIADQLVIDRLKYMCEIEPSHVILLRLPVIFNNNDEMLEVGTFKEYIASRAVYDLNAGFIHEPKLVNHPIALVREPEFMIELQKILVFHWLVGINSTLDNVMIRDGMPISVDEAYISTQKPSRAFMDFVIGELLNFDDETDDLDVVAVYREQMTLLEEAMREVCGHMDFDTMRGILLQSRQTESSLFHRKPFMKLGTNIRTIAENIEEKIDFLNEATGVEFVERLKDDDFA